MLHVLVAARAIRFPTLCARMSAAAKAPAKGKGAAAGGAAAAAAASAPAPLMAGSVALTKRKDGSLQFAVGVKPNAASNDLCTADGSVLVRTTAAPKDGEANEAVVRQLSKELRVPKTSITIVSGATSRHKVVAVAGVTPEALVAALAGLPADD